MLAASLTLAASGRAVLPLRGKMPRTPNGVKNATVDEEQIRAWWSRWPDANIGVATGGDLLVLDVDHDRDGLGTLEALEAEHGPFETLTVRTPTGGLHLYFHVPDGVELRNTSDLLGPGIESKYRGCYVVAPPSIHPSGGAYEYDNQREPAPVPPFLLAAFAPTARKSGSIEETGGTPYGRAALANEAATVRTATKGTRNDTLNKAAFALGQLIAANELARNVGEGVLLDAATACGLSEREAVRTIRSGIDAGISRPREPRGQQAIAPATTVPRGGSDISDEQSRSGSAIGLEDVHAAYRELLLLPDTGAVSVTLAGIVANYATGDAVWPLLVGPPGCGKSEIITSLNDAPGVWPEVADGKTEKSFGNGLRIEWKGKLAPRRRHPNHRRTTRVPGRYGRTVPALPDARDRPARNHTDVAFQTRPRARAPSQDPPDHRRLPRPTSGRRQARAPRELPGAADHARRHRHPGEKRCRPRRLQP